MRYTDCLMASDVYRHFNGRWLRTTIIPPTETRITQAYFIQQQINRELAALIRAQKSGPIATLLQSWDVANPAALSPLLHTMMALEDVGDISARIGWMNRHGIGAPLSVSVQGFPEDRARCCIAIEEGEPNIGIAEYWLWTEYAGHRKAYAEYVRSLADTLGLPALRQGYAAEREFASILPPEVDTDGQRKRRRVLTWTELCAEFTAIDWARLFEAWGIPEADLYHRTFVVSAPAFVHHLQSRMTGGWSPERWRGWMALLVVQWYAGISPHGPLRAAWFDFYRRFLQGMPADDTPAELRMAAVRLLMPNTLGQLWVRAHCMPGLRRQVVAMVENIRKAAATAISKTSWMDVSTRRAAVTKLRRMDVQVCWPTSWTIRETACSLSKSNLVQNLLHLSAAATARNTALLHGGRGACRSPMEGAWERPVFEVNAFYYPEENRFLLPAAILRAPFYDPARSLPWNYGSLGATIGHEFCHAFDAEGRRYDATGAEKDWWTAADDAEYKKRAERVVRLYSESEYRGKAVDGRLTLVENIADLGGLEFALEGARLALGRRLTVAELREFFMSYTISWRSKDRLRRAGELLVTDPHAPPKLRVNNTLRQLDEWYYAFDIGPECAGYIPAAHRIRFFR